MTDATDGGSQIPATSHKIVNTSIDAEAGSLLVYFDDAATVSYTHLTLPTTERV